MKKYIMQYYINVQYSMFYTQRERERERETERSISISHAIFQFKSSKCDNDINQDYQPFFYIFQMFSGMVRQTRDLHPSCSTFYLSSPRLCFFIVI